MRARARAQLSDENRRALGELARASGGALTAAELRAFVLARTGCTTIDAGGVRSLRTAIAREISAGAAVPAAVALMAPPPPPMLLPVQGAPPSGVQTQVLAAAGGGGASALPAAVVVPPVRAPRARGSYSSCSLAHCGRGRLGVYSRARRGAACIKCLARRCQAGWAPRRTHLGAPPRCFTSQARLAYVALRAR